MSILSRGSYLELLEEIPKWKGNYLEIGVYDGDMLKDFSVRWTNKTFYGIDPFISDKDTVGHHGVPIGERMESQRASSYANFKDVPNIVFFEQTSISFMLEKTQDELDLMSVQVVYVDGNHSYRDTLTDLSLSEKLIRRNGLIYIDDFDLPDVLQATHDFRALNESRIASLDKRRIILK